jgi:hypothetical protein
LTTVKRCKSATFALPFTRFPKVDEQNQIRIAAVWLYIVATATLLNSLLLQLSLRFVDLLAGLWLTQASDAFFVGMRSIEPQGAPPDFEILAALIVDVLVVLIGVALGVKVSRGSRRAAGISFSIYAADTAVLAFIFADSVLSRVALIFLGWQALTLLVHIVGTAIIFGAWQTLRRKTRPPARAVAP